jgi:hypothetical protein
VDDFKWVALTILRNPDPCRPPFRINGPSRSNVDEIGVEGPSTPSKVRRRLSFNEDDVLPSTQAEMPETPVPRGTPPEASNFVDLDQSEPETETEPKRKGKGRQRLRNPRSAKKL